MVVVVPILVAVAFVLLHAADYLDLVPAHIARAARSALVVSLLVLMLISWDAYLLYLVRLLTRVSRDVVVR